MSADRLRALLIGLIIVAAVVSYIGNREHSQVLNGLGLGAFLFAVLVYGFWRRAVRNERAARVFDREAKTDEAGTRADQ
jgi:glucose uptake protein GlcU